MIIRKVIQRVLHLMADSTGYLSDDIAFSEQAVYDELKNARATIVKDRDRKDYFSHVMWQTLACVQFEEVDANECNLLPPSGCKILKGTCPLPNSLKIRQVVSQLGNSKYDIVLWNSLQAKLDNPIKSISTLPYFTVRSINGKLWPYLINAVHLENAVIEMIAEDPIEASQFCGNKEALCNPMDTDFHTDSRLEDAVLKLTIQMLLQTRSGARPDVVNNDSNLE